MVEYLVERGANVVALNLDGNLPVDLVEEDEDLKNYLFKEMDKHGKVICHIPKVMPLLEDKPWFPLLDYCKWAGWSKPFVFAGYLSNNSRPIFRARKKLEFKLVLWAISSHNLFACGNFLLVLVYDFIGGWLAWGKWRLKVSCPARKSFHPRLWDRSFFEPCRCHLFRIAWFFNPPQATTSLTCKRPPPIIKWPPLQNTGIEIVADTVTNSGLVYIIQTGV